MVLGVIAIGHVPEAISTPPVRNPTKPQLNLLRISANHSKAATKASVLDGRQPVLVTTFATWCKPCNKEVPTLNKVYSETRGRGLRVVAISLDEKPPFAVAHWMRENKVNYPVFYADSPVRSGRSILQDVSMMPTTLLMSPRGNILRKWLGVVPEKALLAAIKPILRPKKKQ